jgi:hypothetical protein
MKNVIVMLALAFAGLTVSAQGPDRTSMEEKAADRLEYMTIVLDLNTEQVAKIQKMQVAHVEKLKAIKQNISPLWIR